MHNIDQYKFIAISLFFCGFLGIIYVLIFSPTILSFFSPDNSLSSFTIDQVKALRIKIILNSIIIFFLGLIYYYFGKIINLNSNVISSIIGIIFFVWIIYLVELSLRVFPIDSSEEILKKSLSYEPSSFSIHKFPLHHNVYDSNGELKSMIRSGFRMGEEINLSDSSKSNIFILGGSFVYDVKAKLGESWPELVGDYFSTDFQVINAGVPGHRTFDSIGKLFSEIHLYNPKYVLLCNAWNDIKYFSNLEPPNNTLLRLYPGMNHYSHNEINLFKKTIDKFQILLRLSSIFSVANLDNGPEGRYSKKYVGEQRSVISKYALDQYELNIENFIDICRNIDSTPILITQPRLVDRNNIEFDKNRIAYGYANFNHNSLVRAFDKCDSIMHEVAKNKNAHIIDLAKNFSGRPKLFLDHVHTTQLGSQSIAEEVAASLKLLISKQ